MSLITGYQPSISSSALSSRSWNKIDPEFRERLVVISLAFTLYGIFVVSCGASIYALAQKWLNNRNHSTSTLILGFAIFALFSSTTINMATAFLGNAHLLFFSNSQYPCCGPTATLTINILFGDAIVCWRACVLWRGNRIIMAVCAMLLVTTFALGTVDTKYACRLGLGPWKPDRHADGSGNLYEGFSYGLAATVLSLSTNLFATMAVVLKTWQSRRMLRRYFVTRPVFSPTQRLFTLLVESGMVYCALWIVVLVWQAGKYMGISSHRGDNSFWDVFTVVVNGALVPLIAIYPTTIIVVVALGRSQIENRFKGSNQSSMAGNDIHALPLPMHRLAIAVDTTVMTHCDSETRGRSKTVLNVEKEDPDFQRKDSLDSSSTDSTLHEDVV